jgi:mRNA interferase MazF
LKRGEIWTASGGGDYAGKPRPVVIVQDDRFDATLSITICAFTSDQTAAPHFRLPIVPTDANGLKETSILMVDKISTVRKSRLGRRIGLLAKDDVLRLDRAIMVFLGLAGG